MLIELWRRSLFLRRVVVALVLAAAAVLLYVATKLPQPRPVRKEDLGKYSVTHMGEVLRVYQPRVGQDDVVLSYEGAPNELGEVWLDQATPEGITKAMFAGAKSDSAGPVTYTVADPAKTAGEKRCRTTVVVRTEDDAPVPAEIDFAQRDPEASGQQFRQMLIRAPGSVLRVEAHADSETEGQKGLTECPRLLKAGTAKLTVDAGPVYFRVPEGWINLRFFSIDPEHPAFSEDNSTMNHVSLGENGLRANAFDIVSEDAPKKPLLHVTQNGKQGVRLNGIRIGGKEIDLDVDPAAGAQGTRIEPMDLPDMVEKNKVASGLAAGAIGLLMTWAKRTFFPPKPTANRRRRKAHRATDSETV